MTAGAVMDAEGVTSGASRILRPHVTPPELFPDALEQVERARAQEAVGLEAASDDFEADPRLVALSDARPWWRAAEVEVRRLLPSCLTPQFAAWAQGARPACQRLRDSGRSA
ncbi:hypothetical protein OIE69_44565 (plasmid) [Actinacidiphila glaucinigra]|uniref:hypothetical protein n=1 Tax=Actinacidiphila glaucinigra TaxID=235986 RepID=UPI002DDB8345|nr:hypothetical protein [Actinacidiphila glaucinigra]WSD65733.1 hypothetical protein OIE69_43285 [Actinacidiphila glaucinigra]WSD65979.1 hypothetical protein OIE69_44565 [Actinacidiphila glaucinigra]